MAKNLGFKEINEFVLLIQSFRNSGKEIDAGDTQFILNTFRSNTVVNNIIRLCKGETGEKVGSRNLQQTVNSILNNEKVGLQEVEKYTRFDEEKCLSLLRWISVWDSRHSTVESLETLTNNTQVVEAMSKILGPSTTTIKRFIKAIWTPGEINSHSTLLEEVFDEYGSDFPRLAKIFCGVQEETPVESTKNTGKQFHYEEVRKILEIYKALYDKSEAYNKILYVLNSGRSKTGISNIVRLYTETGFSEVLKSGSLISLVEEYKAKQNNLPELKTTTSPEEIRSMLVMIPFLQSEEENTWTRSNRENFRRNYVVWATKFQRVFGIKAGEIKNLFQGFLEGGWTEKEFKTTLEENPLPTFVDYDWIFGKESDEDGYPITGVMEEGDVEEVVAEEQVVEEEIAPDKFDLDSVEYEVIKVEPLLAFKLPMSIPESFMKNDSYREEAWKSIRQGYIKDKITTLFAEKKMKIIKEIEEEITKELLKK